MWHSSLRESVHVEFTLGAAQRPSFRLAGGHRQFRTWPNSSLDGVTGICAGKTNRAGNIDRGRSLRNKFRPLGWSPISLANVKIDEIVQEAFRPPRP